jgi:hypothetical protein
MARASGRIKHAWNVTSFGVGCQEVKWITASAPGSRKPDICRCGYLKDPGKSSAAAPRHILKLGPSLRRALINSLAKAYRLPPSNSLLILKVLQNSHNFLISHVDFKTAIPTREPVVCTKLQIDLHIYISHHISDVGFADIVIVSN